MPSRYCFWLPWGYVSSGLKIKDPSYLLLDILGLFGRRLSFLFYVLTNVIVLTWSAHFIFCLLKFVSLKKDIISISSRRDHLRADDLKSYRLFISLRIAETKNLKIKLLCTHLYHFFPVSIHYQQCIHCLLHQTLEIFNRQLLEVI